MFHPTFSIFFFLFKTSHLTRSTRVFFYLLIWDAAVLQELLLVKLKLGLLWKFKMLVIINFFESLANETDHHNFLFFCLPNTFEMSLTFLYMVMFITGEPSRWVLLWISSDFSDPVTAAILGPRKDGGTRFYGKTFGNFSPVRTRS